MSGSNSPRPTESHRSSLSLMWHASIYASSAAANALVSFLLVPLLTHYLAPSDYGIVEIFLAVSVGLTSVIIAGGNTMITKEHFARSPRELAALTSEIIGTIFLVAMCVTALLIAASFLGIAEAIGLDSSLMVIGVVVVAVGNALTVMLVTGYQLSQRPGLYAAVMNSRTALELGLSIVLVATFGLAWRGRVGGAVLTSAVFIVVVAIVFWRRGIRVAMPREFRSYIVSAAPVLVIASLTGWTHDMSDRLVVAGMLDLHSAGLYSIAYRFGMVISVIETSFARAWQPFFYEHIAKTTHEARVQIVKTTYWYALGLIAVTVCYSMVAPTLMRLMVSDMYVDATGMVPIVAAGYCFAGLWKLFTGYLINAGKNGIYAATLGVTAVLNVGLSIVMVSRWGYAGAAWATLIAFAVGALATAIIAQSITPMPWLLRRT